MKFVRWTWSQGVCVEGVMEVEFLIFNGNVELVELVMQIIMNVI